MVNATVNGTVEAVKDTVVVKSGNLLSSIAGSDVIKRIAEFLNTIIDKIPLPEFITTFVNGIFYFMVYFKKIIKYNKRNGYVFISNWNIYIFTSNRS